MSPRVLLCTVDASQTGSVASLGQLHRDEQARYAALHSVGRRREWLLGRRLVLELLRETGERVDTQALRSRAGGGIEYRALPDRYLSISHSRGLVAAAMAESPVGIDVERLRRRALTAHIDRLFTRDEIHHLSITCNAERLSLFYDYWTLKESACKAVHASIWEGLQRFGFDLTDRDAPRFVDADAGPAQAPWHFWLGTLSQSWRMSLALHGTCDAEAPILERWHAPDDRSPMHMERPLHFDAA